MASAALRVCQPFQHSLCCPHFSLSPILWFLARRGPVPSVQNLLYLIPSLGFLLCSVLGLTTWLAGSQFSDQGLKPCCLQWKHRVLNHWATREVPHPVFIQFILNNPQKLNSDITSSKQLPSLPRLDWGSPLYPFLLSVFFSQVIYSIVELVILCVSFQHRVWWPCLSCSLSLALCPKLVDSNPVNIFLKNEL